MLDPADLAVKMELAEVVEVLGKDDEAVSRLRQVRAAGLDADPAIHFTATYKLAMRTRGTPESEGLFKEIEQLKASGLSGLEEADLEQRSWGKLRGPAPHGLLPGAPQAPHWPSFTDGASADLAGAQRLLVADVDADGRPDLVGWGPKGVRVARRRDQAAASTSSGDRPPHRRPRRG